MAIVVNDQQGREIHTEGGTAGSVPFVDSGGKLTEDASNLSYDDTTNILSAIMTVKQAVEPPGFFNLQFSSVVTGTDTAFADGTQFLTSIFVPVTKTVTGVQYLVGSAGGTDLAYVVLYAAGGTVVANSSTTSSGVTVGAAAGMHTVAFTSTVSIAGPAMYFVGISANGTTAKLRTIPDNLSFGQFATSIAQTHGAIADITAFSNFTPDVGPYVFLY